MPMRKLGLLLKRLLKDVFAVMSVITIAFWIMQWRPCGAFNPPPDPPQERNFCHHIPEGNAVTQYVNYMRNLVFHFDFGYSLRKPGAAVRGYFFRGCNEYLERILGRQLRATFGAEADSMYFEEPTSCRDSGFVVVDASGEPVGAISVSWRHRLEAIRNTVAYNPIVISLQFWTLSAVFAVLAGAPLGIVAALKGNSWGGKLAMLVARVVESVPGFFLGIMLLKVFGLELNWFPLYGWGDNWKQVVLPVIALGMSGVAMVIGVVRRSIRDRLRAGWMPVARVKGLSEGQGYRRVLSGSLLSAAVDLRPLVGPWLLQSFLIERVFSFAGIGFLFVTSIESRDYFLIIGAVAFYSMGLRLFKLVMDAICYIVERRLRPAVPQEKQVAFVVPGAA